MLHVDLAVAKMEYTLLIGGALAALGFAMRGSQLRLIGGYVRAAGYLAFVLALRNLTRHDVDLGDALAFVAAMLVFALGHVQRDAGFARWIGIAMAIGCVYMIVQPHAPTGVVVLQCSFGAVVVLSAMSGLALLVGWVRWVTSRV
ncbi:MAG: hypothetical protein QM831_27975 [Kofleriaceae bacterium]